MEQIKSLVSMYYRHEHGHAHSSDMGKANSFSSQDQDNGKAFPGSIGIMKCVQKRSTSDSSSWLFIARDCSQIETSY